MKKNINKIVTTCTALTLIIGLGVGMLNYMSKQENKSMAIDPPNIVKPIDPPNSNFVIDPPNYKIDPPNSIVAIDPPNKPLI